MRISCPIHVLAFKPQIPTDGRNLPKPIPEIPVSAENVTPGGYTESKWIAEQILLDAKARTDVPIQIVRLCQLCGRSDGHWKETEWFPMIVKSSLTLGCAPKMYGVSLIQFSSVRRTF